MDKAKESFFEADRYAVVGASTDRAKYGNKVLRWYQDHGLNVTPIHPKEANIEGLDALTDVSKLQQPNATSISVITPPKVTLGVLKTALQDHSVHTVWLQPGAEDASVTQWIEEAGPSVQQKVIYGGPCILVQGESLARSKGRL